VPGSRTTPINGTAFITGQCFFEVVSWTKYSGPNGWVSFLLFVRTVLPSETPEAPSGQAPEVGGQALQNTSCSPCLRCTEWSCVVLCGSPRRHNGSGRDWPHKATNRQLECYYLGVVREQAGSTNGAERVLTGTGFSNNQRTTVVQRPWRPELPKEMPLKANHASGMCLRRQQPCVYGQDAANVPAFARGVPESNKFKVIDQVSLMDGKHVLAWQENCLSGDPFVKN
jgi:hypothetical protein